MADMLLRNNGSNRSTSGKKRIEEKAVWTIAYNLAISNLK